MRSSEQAVAPPRPTNPSVKRVVTVVCVVGIYAVIGYMWGWQAWAAASIGMVIGLAGGWILGHDLGYRQGRKVSFGTWVEAGSAGRG